MAVFGRQGRARRRVTEGLQGSLAWQVTVHGRAWVCPLCAQVALDALPEPMEARVEAVLQHLEGSCPAWSGGDGPERSLAEVRKVASVRELRRQVKTELVKSPSWQLIDSTRQWYCPYCGEGTGVIVPADKRMTEDVLLAIVGHVDGCYAHRHGQQEKPLAHLKAIVKYSNQSRRLAENVRKKLEGDPAWRRKDSRSRWVCPYCLQAQEHVDLSSNLLMFENAPRLIAKHLAAACAEFKAGAQPKPLDAPERPQPALTPGAGEPIGATARSSGSGRTPTLVLKGDPAGPIPDTDPAGVAAQRRREAAPPDGGAPERARAGLAGGTQGGSADDSSSREAGERSRRTHHTDARTSGRSGRQPALDPPRAESGSSTKLPVPIDSGKLPALQPSDTGKADLRKSDQPWGRDALFVPAGRGTTLRDLESSGELLLIDDPEVRRLTARPEQDASSTSSGLRAPPAPTPSGRVPRAGSGSDVAPRAPTGRRPAHEWRREIEQELARVRSLAPGGSGEHMPAFDPGGEDELRSLSRTLRLGERGIDVRRLLVPASPPRGDFVDLIDLGGDQLGVLAGGILGEEPEGPLVAAMARNLARQALARDVDPRDVLRRVNTELFADLDGRVFVALLAGAIDLQRLTFRVARAGLPAPLLVNPARQGRFGVLQTEGMVLGIDRGPIFDTTLESRTFELARGDLLVVFTTGLVDARGPAREEFGIERMHQLARRYGGHEVDYFTDKFREYFDLFVNDPALRTTDLAVTALKWIT